MKLFLSYLRARLGVILAFLLFAGLFSAAVSLYRLPAVALAYPPALCALLGLGFLGIDFIRVRRRHAALRALCEHTAALADQTPETVGPVEAEFLRLAVTLQEQTAALQAADALRYRDMVDYYTVWAHQIKTPIAAMKLTLQGEDSPLSRRIASQLFRIEQYVDMVLAFLRLDANTGDYVFRSCDLDGILRPSLRKFAGEFIDRRLRLDYEPVNYTVLTDEKWLAFVIEQLLSNALKYTRTGGVSVTLEAPGTLCITDTGIGIAPEDLPLVFEKGYTGYNGRADRSASGLGLYLCRRICGNLGHGISIQSTVGVGTTVRVDLARRRPGMESHLTKL